MAYVKYPEIDNSYNARNLERWLERYPDLANCIYTIEDKPDGSNLQIITKSNGEIMYGSRNQLLGTIEQAAFFDLENTIKKYSVEISIMSDFAQKSKNTIKWYSEYFGNGIQNRINYGPDKYIRLFGIRIEDGPLISPKEFYELIGELKLTHILIPVYGKASSLEEALNWDTKVKSPLGVDEGQVTEGIVIKPFNKTYVSPIGETFFLKKKNEEFKEKMKVKVKKEANVDPRLHALFEDFVGYLTESRMKGIFSKEGKKITSPNQIGVFLPLILDDAKKDWKKDHPDVTLDKKEEKIVFNGGKFIVDLLRKELSS